MIQREKLFKRLQEGKYYPIIINSCLDEKLRLTQGFTSLINKGFVIKKGKAIYPTHFKFLGPLENREAFQCVIRDNDNHNYHLSIETNKVSDNLCCGYNNSGDIVIIQLKEKISYTDKNSVWKGRVQVKRDSTYYSLVDTKNSKILTKALDGDLFNISIEHLPVEEQITFQKQIQIIQKIQRVREFCKRKYQKE